MLTQALQAMTVDTPGGRIHVQWDHAASAFPNAQLTFFAEFLAATNRYESWVDSYPLSYSSPNAPDKRDVLGTWLQSILTGHKRYADITGLRGDALSLQVPGMEKIVSEDALRRAMARMSQEQSQAWLVPQLAPGAGAGRLRLRLARRWPEITSRAQPLAGTAR